MARGTSEPLCACRLVRPVDPPRARSPPAERHRARHGYECKPDSRRQENSVWNGHYACTCYHPLFVLIRTAIWNVPSAARQRHSADGWRGVLEPVLPVTRARSPDIFRGDAGFANPQVYEYLEAEGSNTRSGYQPTRCCTGRFGT